LLVISRPGVDHKNITIFPVLTRFIKLPIENYLKLLPAKDPDGSKSTAWDEKNEPQIALINAIND
jgi:hypothetical protein